MHCKKRFVIFPFPAGMSLTKLCLGGNNDVIYKLFPPRESLASDIPAGDGKIVNHFLQCVSGEYFATEHSGKILVGGKIREKLFRKKRCDDRALYAFIL
jgi:hypothetical protein